MENFTIYYSLLDDSDWDFIEVQCYDPSEYFYSVFSHNAYKIQEISY